VLEESRGEPRARAERAERDLDAARAELTRVRQETDAAAATPAQGRGEDPSLASRARRKAA